MASSTRMVLMVDAAQRAEHLAVTVEDRHADVGRDAHPARTGSAEDGVGLGVGGRGLPRLEHAGRHDLGGRRTRPR